MFGTTQRNNLGDSRSGENYPQPPTEFGVSSAIKDLIDASISVASNASDLRSALGISAPKSAEQNKPMDSALVSVIASVTQRLREANEDIIDSKRHLTS